MKNILLASVGALALCTALSTSALADMSGISGTLSGSYAGDTNDHGADLWNVNGSLTGLFAPSWGAEVTGGYHSLSLDGVDENLDIWNVGGSLFWNNVQGRLAGTVNYYSTSEFGVDLNATTYGIGGEYYVAPNFTVAVKGGGETIDVSGFGAGDDDSGGYVGGMLQYYFMPNLSLSGSVDYAELAGSHVTSETIKAEYLFSETMPVSIYGGYEHADLGAGGFGLSGDGDLFFVGVKLYMNGASGGTLVDRQRNGSLGYIAEAPILGLSTQ